MKKTVVYLWSRNFRPGDRLLENKKLKRKKIIWIQSDFLKNVS